MQTASTSSGMGRAPRGGSGEDVLVCTQLTKVFKDFWRRDAARAVDNLSLSIGRNEIFGLLGPNGSGKSTTIKMILGLLRPSSGRVALLGKAPDDVSIKRRIGYLPEESYMYGFLNGRETLQYYAKLFEIDHRTRERRIDELLDMLGIAHAQHRPVREYSKGMQRRIGIAQALINDPEFLVLDEPTTGLDPLGTRQIKDLILELGRRGKTVLLSSHLLADVEDCVDRLVILYGGKVRAEGTCESLLESQERTTIEADELDERTISEIDRVIRGASKGEKSIRRVSRPRQSLEALFVDIVERARAENLSTSGATAGGATAAFLSAGAAAAEGEAVIEQLVTAGSTPAHAPAAEGETDAAHAKQDGKAADVGVIGDLLKGASRDLAATELPPAVSVGRSVLRTGSLNSGSQQASQQQASQNQAPQQQAPQQRPKSADVDTSMIDDLLGGGGAQDGGKSGGQR